MKLKPHSQKNRFQKIQWLDLILLISLSILIFGLYLGTRPLNIPDEGRYPNIAREMLMMHQYLIPKINHIIFLDKPILYYWFELISMKWFGINNWAIRLPQAVFGLAGIIITYLFSIKWFNRRTAIFASLILIASPLYYFSARYADMDLEIGIWITATLFCLFNGSQKEILNSKISSKISSTINFWYLTGFILAGFGILTKGLIGFVLPGMVLFFYCYLTGQFSKLKQLNWGLGILILLLITCPWFIFIENKYPGFLHYFFIYQQFDRFTESGFNNVMPFYFYIGILLIALMPWSFLNLGYLSHLKNLKLNHFKKINSILKNPKYRPLIFVFLWVILITLFFSIPHSKIVGYILPVIPGMAILLGFGLNLYYETFKNKQNNQSFKISNKISKWICFSLSLIIGIALFILPGHVKNITLDLKYPFYGLGTLWILGGLITLLNQNIKIIFSSWFGIMAIFCLSAVLLLPKIDHKTHIGLSRSIKNYIHSHHIQKYNLISFENYYEDIPIYLNHDFKYVVYDWKSKNVANIDDWARDFYFGYKQTQSAKNILITPNLFKNKINKTQNKKIIDLIITPKWEVNRLKKYVGHKINLIAQSSQNSVFIEPFGFPHSH